MRGSGGRTGWTRGLTPPLPQPSSGSGTRMTASAWPETTQTAASLAVDGPILPLDWLALSPSLPRIESISAAVSVHPFPAAPPTSSPCLASAVSTILPTTASSSARSLLLSQSLPPADRVASTETTWPSLPVTTTWAAPGLSGLDGIDSADAHPTPTQSSIPIRVGVSSIARWRDALDKIVAASLPEKEKALPVGVGAGAQTCGGGERGCIPTYPAKLLRS